MTDLSLAIIEYLPLLSIGAACLVLLGVALRRGRFVMGRDELITGYFGFMGLCAALLMVFVTLLEGKDGLVVLLTRNAGFMLIVVAFLALIAAISLHGTMTSGRDKTQGARGG